MKTCQTVFEYFRIFSKNDLKLQKLVAMATNIKLSDIFLTLWIISYYMIYNNISFQEMEQKVSVVKNRSIFP